MSDRLVRQTPMVSALAHLPQFFLVLVPELQQLVLEEESRADCLRCPLLPANSGDSLTCEWSFRPDTRCCTYHPLLPNYLVGQALLRENEGSRKIRLRLQDRSGVTPNGVARSREYSECFKRHGGSYGKRKALRCPYWVGGTHTCGIWPDRDPVCRTWFCRHDAGSFGMQRWEKLRQVLLHVEEQMLLFCVRVGNPPEVTAGDDLLIQWFIWCARRSEQLTAGEIASLRTPTLQTLRQELVTEMTRPEPKLPDVVVPYVRAPLFATSGFYLRGYSPWDVVKTTPAVVDLLEQLDGRRSWQQALAAPTVTRHDVIDEHLVCELFRIGILGPSKAAEEQAGLEDTEREKPPPDVLVPAINAPIVDGDRVWVQSATTGQSLVVPMYVFVLLWKLDGTKAWRTALREVAVERNEWIDASLIGKMLRMGLLREPEPSKLALEREAWGP